MNLLIDNIGELVTNVDGIGEGGPLGIRRKAALLVEDGEVAWIGRASCRERVSCCV